MQQDKNKILKFGYDFIFCMNVCCQIVADRHPASNSKIEKRLLFNDTVR